MIKIRSFIKANIFFMIVLLGYIVLMFINPSLSVQGIKNSGYYVKEMLMIMPVIFVLTALLDTWVPKKMIIKYLGKDAKMKGIFLSFVFGSISAGPIYAAFPFCVMLHKKGASVRNIVIILSSWAVVKVPMLLNEAKFLGFKFMTIRWMFTVIAIFIFSYIAGKIVKDEDLLKVGKKENIKGVFINKSACMGCSICTKKYPVLFEMNSKKAIVKQYEKIDINLLNKVIESCPVNAIEYN